MVEYLNAIRETLIKSNWAQLDGLSTRIKSVRADNHRLFVCGNGGSHAVALHWGVDLAKVGEVDVTTLGVNNALSTALANDLDYQVGFSTELALRARQGDVLVALSCSGRSKNILAVMNEARKIRMPAYLITGPKALELPEAHVIRLLNDDYGVLEDCFAIIGHWLTKELQNT